ncbi:MAG: hypothetical protein MI742_11070 [Desulfobacterales bacterium]|nr:hypothetical protein [Desulfobacterales bacterium]
MKKSMAFFMAAALVMAFATLTSAQDSKGMHGMDHGSSEMSDMDHGMGMNGETIRKEEVEGLLLTYRLINVHKNLGKLQGMEGMEGLKEMIGTVPSHHMMVDVTKPDGGIVDGVKVGFVLTTPDGARQKAMGMAMGGGHGADLNMKAKGAYTVKVKVKAGKKVVMDQFTLTIK